jgi:hypothetical protein
LKSGLNGGSGQPHLSFRFWVLVHGRRLAYLDDGFQERRPIAQRTVRSHGVVVHASSSAARARTAAIIAVEVDPVARMRAAQRNDAGAGVPRRITPDVGEAPLVAGAAAARKEVGHPVRGSLAQTFDDQVEIVARRLCCGREGVVEVKQGSPAPARPA